MIVDKGALYTAAADVEAALHGAMSFKDRGIYSRPDFARTVFSHREIVSVETGC